MGPSAGSNFAFRAIRKVKHIAKTVFTKSKTKVIQWMSKPEVAARGQYVGPDGFRAQITVLEFEKHPRISSTAKFRLKVENTGTQPWETATNPKIGPKIGPKIWVRWFMRSENQVENILSETYCFDLPALSPGSNAPISKEIPVPINSVFDVAIEFNLRQEGGTTWYAPPSDAARVFRHIEGQCAHEAANNWDYEKLYAELDLEKNYWTIVGPATREEYEQLGRGKRDQLISQGLTADSKVLDVGCGTGQLAGPLSEILGPNGLYYGTDLAGPAIEFCKRKYPQSNFHFLKNDHNIIPIQEIQFDVLYLGSVFTHMYPEDIHIMLSDLRRLMAPTGFVLVDAFVSQEIPNYIGNRSMIQLNETKLHSSFYERGFHFTEFRAIPWNEHCRRVIYKLTALDAAAKKACA